MDKLSQSYFKQCSQNGALDAEDRLQGPIGRRIELQ
jgi:hypothetical protein